jgi:hypothetical protein
MATLSAQTTWHNNPRPAEAIASSVFIEQVASPYYYDGRDVPVVKQTVTPAALTTFLPGSSIDVAGPAPVVSFSLTGLFLPDSTLTLDIQKGVGTPLNTVLTNTLGRTLNQFEAAGYAASKITSLDTQLLAKASQNTVTIELKDPTVVSLTIVTASVA